MAAKTRTFDEVDGDVFEARILELIAKSGCDGILFNDLMDKICEVLGVNDEYAQECVNEVIYRMEVEGVVVSYELVDQEPRYVLVKLTRSGRGSLLCLACENKNLENLGKQNYEKGVIRSFDGCAKCGRVYCRETRVAKKLRRETSHSELAKKLEEFYYKHENYSKVSS